MRRVLRSLWMRQAVVALLVVQTAMLGGPWGALSAQAAPRGKGAKGSGGGVLYLGLIEYKAKPPANANLGRIIDDKVRARLEGERNLTLVEPGESDSQPGAQGTEADREAALAKIEAGLKLVKADPEKAEKALSEAADAIRAVANQLKMDDFNAIRDLYAGLARAADAREDDEALDTWLRQLRVLGELPESLPNRLAKRARKLKGTLKVRLAVATSDGDPVKLWVNGEAMDGATYRDNKAFAGWYFVRAKIGERVWADAIEVKGDKIWEPAADSLGGADPREGIAAGSLGRGVRDDLYRAARAAGADRIAWLVVAQGPRKNIVMATYVYDAKSGRVLAGKGRLFDADRADRFGARMADPIIEAAAGFPEEPKRMAAVGPFDPTEGVTDTGDEEALEEREAGPAAGDAGSVNLDSDRSIALGEGDESKAVAAQAETQEASFSEAPPIYTRWWFWTLIGAVVVAGSVTGAVLAQPAKPDNTPRMNVPGVQPAQAPAAR